MTGQSRIIGMATATRVHGRHQLKARMIADMGFGARHINATGFDRLAQRI